MTDDEIAPCERVILVPQPPELPRRTRELSGWKGSTAVKSILCIDRTSWCVMSTRMIDDPFGGSLASTSSQGYDVACAR